MTEIKVVAWTAACTQTPAPIRMRIAPNGKSTTMAADISTPCAISYCVVTDLSSLPLLDEPELDDPADAPDDELDDADAPADAVAVAAPEEEPDST